MGERARGGDSRREPHGDAVCRASLALCAAALVALTAGPAAAQYLYNPATAGAAITPPPAGAPPWLVTPSLGLSETWTDNVNLTPPGQTQTELITSIQPGLQVTGQTAHLQAALDFAPQILIFDLGTSSPLFQPNMLGTGHAEIVPDTFFFDGSASLSQNYVNLAGPVAATTLTTSSNLQTAEAVNASPYLVHHFEDYVDSKTQYRFTYSGVAGNTQVDGIQTAPQLYNEISQVFSSGDYFGVLGWKLTGDYNRTSGLSSNNGVAGGFTGTDTYVTLDASYPIVDRLSATGEIGWEHISNPTITTQSSGPIWSLGFRYDPAPYASLSASAGQRYGGSNYAFNLRYDVGPQTHVNASYTQTITTTQFLIANNVNNLVVGPNGTIISPITGLPVSPGGLPITTLSLANGSFLDKHFEMDLNATRDRDTYSFTAYLDSQSQQVQISNTQAFGATAGWTRALWPDLSSNLSGSYSLVNFLDGSGRTDNYYFINATLTYTLNPTTSSQLSFVRTDRQSNQPGNNLTVDQVTISVTKRF